MTLINLSAFIRRLIRIGRSLVPGPIIGPGVPRISPFGPIIVVASARLMIVDFVVVGTLVVDTVVVGAVVVDTEVVRWDAQFQ